MGRARVDAFAVAASVLATVMAIVYLAVAQEHREHGGGPVAWPAAMLIGGAAAAAYGAARAAPYGRTALLVAGLCLVALGVLAIITIGVPILLAGALSLAAAIRRGRSQAP